MLSKKLVTTLAFTLASCSALHASPAPQYTYNPTKAQKIANWWEQKVIKYARPVSAACGIAAAVAFFATTQNKYSSLPSKLVDTASVGLSASLASLFCWGFADFLIMEAAD